MWKPDFQWVFICSQLPADTVGPWHKRLLSLAACSKLEFTITAVTCRGQLHLCIWRCFFLHCRRMCTRIQYTISMLNKMSNNDILYSIIQIQLKLDMDVPWYACPTQWRKVMHGYKGVAIVGTWVLSCCVPHPPWRFWQRTRFMMTMPTTRITLGTWAVARSGQEWPGVARSGQNHSHHC